MRAKGQNTPITWQEFAFLILARLDVQPPFFDHFLQKSAKVYLTFHHTKYAVFCYIQKTMVRQGVFCNKSDAVPEDKLPKS